MFSGTEVKSKSSSLREGVAVREGAGPCGVDVSRNASAPTGRARQLATRCARARGPARPHSHILGHAEEDAAVPVRVEARLVLVGEAVQLRAREEERTS
jgi:hypothetical protein